MAEGQQSDASGFGKRVLCSVLAAIPGALVGVFLRQVLIQLGWLDSIALAASKFLAVHVSPSLVGWTAALILALALYGFFLWKVWKPPRLVYRDRHHLGRQAETAPVAGLGMDVSRAAPAPQTPLGPRLLSAQQQLALIGELSPLSPEVGTSQVLFTPSGNESHGYWEGFLEVFTRAGLKPHVGTDVPRSPEEVGVMVVVAGQGAAEDLSGRLVAALHNVGIDAHLIERDNPQGFDLRLFIGPQPL